MEQDADTTTPAGSASPDASAATTVSLSNSRFMPKEITAAVGQPVVFTNDDPFEHTVTSATGSAIEFDSGKLGEGEAFTVTFDQPGKYQYFCRIHPTMQGSITVG